MNIVEENKVKLSVSVNNDTPERTDIFFNPKIRINRELVLCGLSAYLDERVKDGKTPARCLDAFSASGALGLQWQKHLKQPKLITMNDIKPAAVQTIHQNCNENDVNIVTGHVAASDQVSDGVEILCQDANVVLLQRAFDFVHLDPFGTSVHYLEAAFRNTPNQGIVSVTSTDLGAVYGRCPNITKRNYFANVTRSEYYRELAARLILGVVTRAAARCNKGVEVLLSVAYEHFILVMVQVVRGPRYADNCINKIQRIIHCLICGERSFVPSTYAVEHNYYQMLLCSCHTTSPGKTALFLGPVWSGRIFNSDFILRMKKCAVSLKLDSKVQDLLATLFSEAVCSSSIECVQACQASHGSNRTQLTQPISSPLQQTDSTSKISDVTSTILVVDTSEVNIETRTKKRPCDVASNTAKRICTTGLHEVSPDPIFYYNIHRHTAKGKDALKMKKVILFLKQKGYRASRTHFDPVAIRTDASLTEFLTILTSNSLPTKS